MQIRGKEMINPFSLSPQSGAKVRIWNNDSGLSEVSFLTSPKHRDPAGALEIQNPANLGKATPLLHR